MLVSLKVPEGITDVTTGSDVRVKELQHRLLLLPPECLLTHMFNTVGPDNGLDVVISLLTFGFYPNVCYHKEKRKILTTEGRNALIHKSSVNCPFSSHDMTYPSPFFIFGEKVRPRLLSTGHSPD